MSAGATVAIVILPGVAYILGSVAWQLSKWFGDWA